MHRLGEKRKLLHTEQGDLESSLASGSSSGDSSLDTPPKKKTCTKSSRDSSKVSLKGIIKEFFSTKIPQYFTTKILSMFSTNREPTPPSTTASSSIASNSPSSQTTAYPASRSMEQLTSTPCTNHPPFTFSLSPSILSVKDRVPTHQPAKDFSSQKRCKMPTCMGLGFKRTSVTPTLKTNTFIPTTNSHATRLPFIYSSTVPRCHSTISPQCHSTIPRLTLPTETSTLPQASIYHDVSKSDDVPSRKPQTSILHGAQSANYWTQWLEDFKGTHKHSQADRQAMMEIAKAKLQLSKKQRIDLEDQRVARLRQGFSHIYLDSDEEEEEIKTTWILTNQQMEKVAEAIGHGPKEECLSERYRIRISRGDLRTLTGLVWLNDEVINFYFNMISENSNREAGLKVYTFNSFFYTKFSQSGYAGVRRWTKKVDLFDHDLILLPVHLGMHWCLAAINLKTCQFQYYDSLLGSNPACLARLREYLKSEFMDKKKSELNLSEWTDYCPRDIPFQTNSSDCGVFTCMYARHLAKQAPFHFCQDDMADIRNHMIYEILEQTLS